MKKLSKIKLQKKQQRHRRVRAKVKGTAERPRLSIFKSNKYIYAQIINDELGVTLIQAQDLNEKTIKSIESDESKGKISEAYKVGQLIAKRALEKGIEKIVFDRGGYKYFGRIKAIADGARKGGLKF